MLRNSITKTLIFSHRNLGVFCFNIMTYSEKLKSPKWQRKRLTILERDNFECQNCGDSESQLQVHHLHYVYGKEIWDYKDDSLMTLCSDCHKKISETKKNIKGLIDFGFLHTEYLDQLHECLTHMWAMNPLELSNLSKHCIKELNKKNKKIKHG